MAAESVTLDRLRQQLRQLRAENEDLRRRRDEAEQALEAIRAGEVESLVIESPQGPRIFSLEGATQSYRILVEEMNEGAATLAENGTILYCNRCLARLLDVPLQRIVGRAFGDYVAERHRPALESLLDRARAAEVRAETALCTAVGDEIPAYLALSAMMDAGRRLFCLVATDLREQKHSEALARAERAARESAAQLLEADRRKTQFLGMLSHELRNPLSPIRNSLYILQHAEPGGEQARRAQTVIDRQVRQLSHLVDDLLDVTRITRNKIQLKKDCVDLAEVVRRAAEDNRAAFEKAEVRLELSVPERRVPLHADATRIAQVVGNLLNNAAKFTQPGGEARVTVTVEDDEAVVRVADTGIGMDAATLNAVFEPFMQGDETLARSRGGLGLGLALVKALVELHGGSVEAKSGGHGQGSEFVVRLPVDRDAAAMPQPEPLAATGPARARRVLVVEDNLDSAQSLCEILELFGHRVEVVHDGDEVLAVAGRFQPEVILCDIGLPHADGYELARRLRADEPLRHAYLVALTGYASAEDIERAAAAGFDRHVAKPPSPEDIQRLLADVPPQSR